MPFIASPSTRKLAMQKGIDLEDLSKKLGREYISKEDLFQGAVNNSISRVDLNTRDYWDVDHSAWGEIEIRRVDRISKIASDNLKAAHTEIPVVTHHDSADILRIENLRKRLKSEGTKVTQLSFHIAVLSRLLKKFPKFNASISSDGESIIFKKYVHIGIAVETEVGLVVPVIRNADFLSVTQISKKLVDLSSRARNRKIKPHEMGGASMTISSLGGIGGTAFSPMINPPEVAILGITKVEICPVWNGKEFIPIPKVPLDLSYDHRIINGADAARFLNKYCELLKNPAQLIVSQYP